MTLRHGQRCQMPIHGQLKFQALEEKAIREVNAAYIKRNMYISARMNE